MSDLNSKFDKVKAPIENIEKKENLTAKAEDTAKLAAVAGISREDILNEVSEGVMAKEVSEKAQEGSEVSSSSTTTAGQSGAAATTKDDQILKLQQQLKESKLPQAKMVKEIKHVLQKEEKILTKKAHKCMKEKAYASLNEIVAKIRAIHQMLEELAYAAYEAVKSLWLKVVHNINA